MTKYMNNIYTYINGLKQTSKMNKFTHNERGQLNTINNIIILTKQGTDTIYLNSDEIS